MGKKSEHWLNVLCKDDNQVKLKLWGIRILIIDWFFIVIIAPIALFFDNYLLKMIVEITFMVSIALSVIYGVLLGVIAWIIRLDNL
ncbi:hypothetical protein INF23_05870 [Ligilactobacillus salivarius]|uniref:hypothetical protein n=1 Tax=Ligilactobacillus salivarius TaxID=1624 RepID=UPI001876C938|nr:hypothetical protein [Ligilactobacillus salivarius]MBE5067132.1 hypothetical protein [Ligilactobacillus salivarius]